MPTLADLRVKANEALTAGRRIVDELAAGKYVDAEKIAKQEEASKWFDEVDKLTSEIRLMERAASMQQLATEPATDLRLPVPVGKDGGVVFGLSESTQALLQRGGYGAKLGELAGSADADVEARKRFATAVYWKMGKNSFEQAPELAGRKDGTELKALATDPGAAGGFLVAPTVRARLIELQEHANAIRQIANVLPPIPGGSSITPAEEAHLADAAWTTEVGTGTEDAITPFGQRVITPHPLAKRIKVSRTLLRAATLANVEEYILSRFARRFNLAEEVGFISGNGAQQPLGLLNSGISTVVTATATTMIADDVINFIMSLPAAYARNAKIVCNRSWIRRVRLLRGTDVYFWAPEGLAPGIPATILGVPYFLSDSWPTGLSGESWVANATPAIVGDFSYYWIVDSLNFEVQRLEELYAETNQVGFIGRKETDGMCVLADAFRLQQIRAS